MSGHKSHGRNRLPDPSVIEEFPARLNPASQKRVGRTSHQHALLTSRFEHLPAFRPLDGKGLFTMHVLPRLDSPEVHLSVHLRNGEIHHNLNLRIAEQFLHRTGLLNSELLRLRLGPLHQQIRTGYHIQ